MTISKQPKNNQLAQMLQHMNCRKPVCGCTSRGASQDFNFSAGTGERLVSLARPLPPMIFGRPNIIGGKGLASETRERPEST